MACKHSICGVCGGKKLHTKYIGIGTTLNEVCSSKCQAAQKEECSCKCEGKFHKGANSILLNSILNPKKENTKVKAKKSVFQPITMYDYLAEFLNGVKIKTSSFDRYSDRNYRKDNKKITLFWLSPKGKNIDTLANDFISETGFNNYDESDIINAIVNYVNDYPSGIKKYIEDVEAERIREEEFYKGDYFADLYNNEPVIFGNMKLKKGSAAAKAYMAKIRAKKGTAKKVNGITDTLKRKAVSVQKKVAYNVIDKTLKSANTKEKAALTKAKKLIQNTYLGASQKVGAVKTPIQYKGYTINFVRGNYRAIAYGNPQFDETSLVKVKKAIDNYLNPKKVGYKADRTNILKTATVYLKKYKDMGYSRKEAVKNANMDAVFVNGYHKDTKSHNVNIKVVSGVSGIKNKAFIEIEETKNLILEQTKMLEDLTKAYKRSVSVENKKALMSDIKTLKNIFIPHNKRLLKSLQMAVKKSI